jgi:hypothetical protein
VILQNISKAIREQNYYAVALEFFIVIAGVVIGFQVNAWNEARQERLQGEINLALILDEISTHRDEYERMSEQAASIGSWLRLVAEVVEDPELARSQPDEVIRAGFLSRYRAFRPLSREVYEGMESSGDIARIADIEAVRRIRAYYREHARFENIYSDSYTAWLSYNQAMAGHLSAAEILGHHPTPDAEIPWDGVSAEPLMITPDRAQEFAEGLRTDPDVRKWLPEIEAFQAGVNGSAFAAAQSTQALLDELDASSEPDAP